MSRSRLLLLNDPGRFFPTLLVLIPFTVYWVTAPRTVTMEDSGLFILNAYFMGLNHPSGYPLHTFLGKLFVLLAPGTVAFRVHLLSMAAACASVVFVYHISLRLKAGAWAAFLGALCLAFSATFWYQAIIAEVYMLAAAVFLGVFLLALQLEEKFDRRRWYLFWFLLGLSTTAHLALAVFAFPAVFIQIKKNFPRDRTSLVLGFVCFLAGLTPHLHLILAPLYTEYLFSYPLRGAGDLIGYLSRELYTAQEAGSGFSLNQAARFLRFHGEEMIDAFHPVGFALFLPGLLLIAYRWKRSRIIAFSWLLFYTLSILIFWRQDFSYLTKEIWRNFHLLPLAIMAIVLTRTLDWLYTRARTKALRTIFVVSGLMGVFGLVAYHWTENNLRHDTFAEEHARNVLESLPADAMLVVRSDPEIGPFGYVNKILGVRRDVVLVSQENRVFPDRIYARNDTSELARAMRATATFQAHLEGGSRVFSTQPFHVLLGQARTVLPFPLVDSGWLFELLPQGREPYEFSDQTIQDGTDLMTRFVEGAFSDHFRGLAGQLLLPYCRMFVRNDIAHPVAREYECLLETADRMQAQNRFAAADEKYREFLDIPADHPGDLLKHVYFSLFANRLRWLENNDEFSEERKRRLLQEAIHLTFESLRKDFDCRDRLFSVYLQLFNRQELKFDRKFVQDKFKSCSAGARAP